MKKKIRNMLKRQENQSPNQPIIKLENIHDAKTTFSCLAFCFALNVQFTFFLRFGSFEN